MKKTYSVVDAAVLFSLTPAGTPDGELKAILVSATDIPADKIDTCWTELKASGMVNSLRGLAMVQKMASGKEPTVEAMREAFKGATWTDDGESHATYQVEFEDEDGNKQAEVSIKTHF